MAEAPNKNVLVVGGAAGIGKEIALHFARKGHRVAVADINLEALDHLIAESGMPDRISGFQVDAGSWDSVCGMVSDVYRDLGAIHTLIYSAGITKKIDFADLDWTLWKRTMSINLNGLFYCIKAVAPCLIEQQEGSIVIIGSGSAITGTGGGAQYAASKGGAFGLMRSLVTDLGKHGINVNVIAPRVIESQMLDALYPSEASKEELKKMIPIGRLGRPSDISELTDYLSSRKAGYIHGQILVLDGGRTYQGKVRV